MPMPKQSMRSGPHDTAAGALMSVPPRLSQSLQPLSYHLCHSALSVPHAKTSRRPAAQDDAAGDEVRMPPRLSQSLQPLSYHLCHSALSVPRAKTSRRPCSHDATPGALVSVPPRLSQSLQPLSYHLCHSALSVPRAKTSSLPELQELTPAPEVRTPPRLSQSVQVISRPPGDHDAGMRHGRSARIMRRGKRPESRIRTRSSRPMTASNGNFGLVADFSSIMSAPPPALLVERTSVRSSSDTVPFRLAGVNTQQHVEPIGEKPSRWAQAGPKLSIADFPVLVSVRRWLITLGSASYGHADGSAHCEGHWRAAGG